MYIYFRNFAPMKSFICPSNLKSGDTVALISPAKAIDDSYIDYAIQLFESWDLKVIVGKNARGNFNYFSSTDTERIKDLQWAIDHPDVKAIICNRGGYGAVRIMEKVSWANFLREPKWLMGFSDITNFHLKALDLSVQSIHCSMPLNFQENTTKAIESIKEILFTSEIKHQWENKNSFRTGTANGTLIGGNLSILFAHLGTKYRPDFEGKILFIEDLAEQWYHIDRIFYAFQQAGVWEKISGLIVGGMTNMRDTEVPTKLSLEAMIQEQLQHRKIPFCIAAPFGHINDNRALIVGRETQFSVTENQCEVIQKSETN